MDRSSSFLRIKSRIELRTPMESKIWGISAAKRLTIERGEYSIVSFRRRAVVGLGIVDCVPVFGVVLLDLVADMSRLELGAQFGFGFRRQVADGRSEIDA